MRTDHGALALRPEFKQASPTSQESEGQARPLPVGTLLSPLTLSFHPEGTNVGPIPFVVRCGPGQFEQHVTSGCCFSQHSNWSCSIRVRNLHREDNFIGCQFTRIFTKYKTTSQGPGFRSQQHVYSIHSPRYTTASRQQPEDQDVWCETESQQ